ncbi:tetratricopeptide repeat protein [Pseudomonas typographi]|uniref:tetratricopeptide repeat protein n=1 Tax=Pseudomonas typographi TaxID=2715964 RepID=UPI0016891C1A|nr:tetratricopeptide repeat protein [Pseudomonas typographi]MBD1586747.1 tetratricopeptide repeat protein [Pseudomonas typographi]
MHKQSPQVDIQRIATALAQAEKTGNTEAQIRLYEKLTALVPDTALAHAQLAHLYFDQNDVANAGGHARQALALPQEDKVDALLFDHLCTVPAFIDDLAQARQWYRQAPNLWRFKLLHEALEKVEAYDEMESTLHSLLGTTSQRDYRSQLLTVLAQVYYAMGRFHDAIACYQLGLEITPQDRKQLFNIGAALEHVGRYQDAYGYYQRVLEVDPQHAGVHNNIALLMLRLGEFESGWQHYEWRWQATQKEHEQHFNIPRWSGDPLAGRTLLVWGEQGIGDHIMFASQLNELMALNGALHYEIYARLDRLFERSFPAVSFIRREQSGAVASPEDVVFKQTWPQADVQIPAGSLPALLRKSREAFGAGAAYLKADANAVAAYRTKYREQFPGKKLIGLSWRGGASIRTERQSRRLSQSDLLHLRALQNVQFIDLQYNSTPEELAELRAKGLDIFHDDSVNAMEDMDPLATQLCALDAVLSVDNTNVHLAGALGVRTYALIQLNPNWRWGLNEGPSYWYNSVRLFRNRELSDWKVVLERVMAAMKDDGVA